MKNLTITATGGLCNRMRVLASVYHAAPHLHHHIRVVWRSVAECHARFDQLFQPLPESRLVLDSGSWFDSPANRTNYRLPALFRMFRGFHEHRDFVPPHGFSLESLSPDKSYFFDTCQCMADYPRTLPNQIFRPLPILQNEIDHIVSQFTPRTIGVHVRRSDHQKSILHSPTQAFITRLDALVAQGQDTRIFLCTDDETVKSQFLQHYGERLLTRHVCMSRGELQGIRDAVIDLWCLSKTSYLLGSYYSSFSDAAAELSGIPFETINIAP